MTENINRQQPLLELDLANAAMTCHSNTFRTHLQSINRGVVTVTDSNNDVAILTVPAPTVYARLIAAVSTDTAAAVCQVIKRIEDKERQLAKHYKKLTQLLAPPSASHVDTDSVQSADADADAVTVDVAPRRSKRHRVRAADQNAADQNVADQNVADQNVADQNVADQNVADDAHDRSVNRKGDMDDDELRNRYKNLFHAAKIAIDAGTVAPCPSTLGIQYAAVTKFTIDTNLDLKQGAYMNVIRLIKDAAVDTMIGYFIISVIAYQIKQDHRFDGQYGTVFNRVFGQKDRHYHSGYQHFYYFIKDNAENAAAIDSIDGLRRHIIIASGITWTDWITHRDLVKDAYALFEGHDVPVRTAPPPVSSSIYALTYKPPRTANSTITRMRVDTSDDSDESLAEAE
jgi:hypothetical protein